MDWKRIKEAQEQINALMSAAMHDPHGSAAEELYRAVEFRVVERLASRAFRAGRGPLATTQDGSASPFRELPEGVHLYNAGQRCDMEIGPCACGAWHLAPAPPMGRQ